MSSEVEFEAFLGQIGHSAGLLRDEPCNGVVMKTRNDEMEALNEFCNSSHAFACVQ